MRRRLIVIAAVTAVFSIAAVTVFRNRILRRNEPTNNPSASTHRIGASVPPFSTREPESYQATRVITFTEAATEQTDVAVPLRTTRVLLARSGAQRRDEYEAGSMGTIVYLENAGGRFILLPQARLYADANEATNEHAPSQLNTESTSIPPDLLLNSQLPAIQYHKMGAELIDGRIANKYRVITDKSGNSESFIWVDEQLGMPVASQYNGANANNSMRVSMQLQDIRTEVDPRIFVLPADYRKVAASQLLDMIRAGKANPAAQDERK